MKVKFKHSEEPSIQYRVKSNNPVFMYDEVLEKETNCIELEVLGYVAQELLEETESSDNIDAIDVLIETQKNILDEIAN